MIDWTPNIYSLFLFISTLVAALVAAALWQRRKAPGALQLLWLVAAAGFWAATYGMELGSPTLEEKLFWARIEVLVIPALPVLALIMVLHYLGKAQWLTKKRLAFLFVWPVLATLVYWTNGWHSWMWENMHLIPAGPITTLKADQNWFYWLYLAYTYALLVASGALLAQAYRQSEPPQRRQIRLILVGMSLIAVINGFAQADIFNLPDLDWTPFSFILLGVFAAWGLLRLDFFQLSELAAEVFEPLVTPRISNLLREDYQRARSLAIIALMSIALLISAELVRLFVFRRSLAYFWLYAFLFLAAYRLSHTSYYAWGIRLLLLASASIPLATISVMPVIHPEHLFHILAWGLPTLMLGGWLLSPTGLWGLFAMMSGAYGAVIWKYGPLPPADTITLYALMATFTVFSQVLYLLRAHILQQVSQMTDEVVRGQKYLSTVINSLNNPFYVIDAQNYAILLANDAARNMGIASKKTCYALTHNRETPCSGLEHPCPLQHVLKNKQPYTVEHIHFRPDGSAYYVEVHGYPILNEQGEVIQMIEYSLDITARKQAEAEIRKLTRSIEESDSSVVITDADGTIEYVNPAFERISGYSAAEAVGQNPRILKSGKMPPGFYEEMWRTLASGAVWRGEILNRKKDGSLYWEFTTISPVMDEEGRVTNYVSVKEDITERKRIEAELEQKRAKVEALLLNTLPEEVVAEIKEKGGASPVLLENASVLFADFVNFTGTAEQLSPQDLVDMLDLYFSAFDGIIEKYGIEKLKTIGDSYMCASGVPTPDENHAVAITKAALDMLAFVAKEKERRLQAGLPAWDVRIGISSGPLVAGVVGRKKYAYDVWGDTVVMAARMEETSVPGRINISQSTYTLIHRDFLCQYRGRISAKYKGAVNMYFVVRPR